MGGGSRGAGRVRLEAQFDPADGSGVPVHLGSPARVGVGAGVLPGAHPVLLGAAARGRAGSRGRRAGHGRRGRGDGRSRDHGGPARHGRPPRRGGRPGRRHDVHARLHTGIGVRWRVRCRAKRCRSRSGRRRWTRARAGSGPSPGPASRQRRRGRDGLLGGLTQKLPCRSPACRCRFRRTCRLFRCRALPSCRCRCRPSRPWAFRFRIPTRRRPTRRRSYRGSGRVSRRATSTSVRSSGPNQGGPPAAAFRPARRLEVAGMATWHRGSLRASTSAAPAPRS